MKTASSIVLLAMAGFVASVSAADCQREDIDHYLDRGFTPKQVLELCRNGNAARTPAQADQQGRALDTLSGLIEGQGFRLDEQYFGFSQTICVAYDRPNYAQQRKKACGMAHYQIARAGLKVDQTRKKLLFWGRNEVLLSSPEIERRYELGQQALSERNQQQLQRELPSGNELSVPARDGVSVSRLQQALQALALPPG